MTASGESWKETTGVKLEVMSAKTKTRIGFWNVRTMYETGKLAQVTVEMRWYNLHVLGVSESTGLEIATLWSPMWPKIECWRLDFQHWSPAGESRNQDKQ